MGQGESEVEGEGI
ncbi:unnamed protein product, partial [Rotaria sp. Silwood1]